MRRIGNWVRNLAVELGEALNLSSPTVANPSEQDLQAYEQFLMEVLQATAESEGDARRVYPLLAENTAYLNPTLAEALRHWVTRALPEMQPDEVQPIAGVIANFSNLIQQFPLGNKASNMEIAIAGYVLVLTLFTRNAFPQDWAMTQNNLGAAYLYRIVGDKAQNLEEAIKSYTAALQVRTRDALPQDWAMTQNNLGEAYRNRIVGDKAQNLEEAIAFFTAALQVRTRDTLPQDWAETQNNLGNAYSQRIVGDKAQNLEVAIKSYSAVLQVLTHDAFPQHWAITQNNLGEAYRNRIVGDKAQNLEVAIKSYTAALQVLTRDTFPQHWAITQNNLGNAYSQKIVGDKAQNLEVAIKSYTAALQVRTRDAFPQDWAITQYNLGLAYSKRIVGNKAQNLEVAIKSYTAALQVLTRDAFPQHWAITQNNLGTTYSDRIVGDKAQNLGVGIKSLSAALQVLTRDAFPQNHAETLFNLGIAYQNAQRFTKAYTTFKDAIETVEFLRGEIVSGDESKRQQAEQWNKLYCLMVDVCLELDNITEAIEYAERSKTRNLVELILERDLKAIFPSEAVTRLEQLQDEIASGQYQLQNGKAENQTALTQYLRQLRQQRNDLQNRHLPIGYGFKLDRFQATLDEHTAVIEWYITNTGFETFIITRDSLQRLEVSNTAKQRATFLDWFDEYRKAYFQTKDEWKHTLASRLSRLAEILHLEDILTLVPKNCSRLVLILHRYLHLLPVQALPLSPNGKAVCLLDRFPNGVSYAPSCQLLLQAQQRKRPNFSHLFAIQNPTNDLDYTDLEAD